MWVCDFGETISKNIIFVSKFLAFFFSSFLFFSNDSNFSFKRNNSFVRLFQLAEQKNSKWPRNGKKWVSKMKNWQGIVYQSAIRVSKFSFRVGNAEGKSGWGWICLRVNMAEGKCGRGLLKMDFGLKWRSKSNQFWPIKLSPAPLSWHSTTIYGPVFP